MTNESKPAQPDQLCTSLQVLETQRVLLGAAIEPALEAVRLVRMPRPYDFVFLCNVAEHRAVIKLWEQIAA